jgi:hypothetical protein
MRDASRNEKIRWQVIKAMLDEFPLLREKTRKYLGLARKQQPST